MTDTAFLTPSSAATNRAEHPLDPLTPDEIRAATAIARRELKLAESARFATIRLLEPPKHFVRAHRAGSPLGRRAWIAVMDTAAGTLHDGVIDLGTGTAERWTEHPGLQGPLLLDEYERAAEVIRNDPRWQAALHRHGITDPDQVRIDAWMIGNFGFPEEQGRRLCASLAYLVERRGDLPYARPIEGLVAYVDLSTMTLTRVLDSEPVPVPVDPGRYDPESVGPLRKGLRPIEISQPDGPSFTVDGHEIRWQNWTFRWSFNAREGLVLHQIEWDDHGTVRPILYRASLSEMVVPYGDPDAAHYWQGAFDLGDFGIGRGVNSLQLGCDCLGVIQYLDIVSHDDFGEPLVIKQGICLHEEDFSILWKHWDFVDDHTEVRRQRRLVISLIGTNLNYDYGYYWYFYLDGSIEFEVKLTGVMQTKALVNGAAGPYANLVAPGLAAIHHQHLFNARLDMEVDGPRNTVQELDIVPADEGPNNPYRTAIVTRTTPLRREAEARRRADAAVGRTWLVTSADRRNALGELTAYQLVPQASPTLLAAPGSSLGRRAEFARHHLWVTPFAENERHAGGEYPNQHPGGAGLAEWTAGNRSIEDTDLVVWHTFGTSHAARPEDWPVMPVERAGFRLRPWGFFDRNPTLDVPPSDSNHCHAD
ncbi:MAG TPA: primary-amine oxidase [Mycobacterium sp.]|nr:primary-amine oxidase [Mycobacterium sp.]